MVQLVLQEALEDQADVFDMFLLHLKDEDIVEVNEEELI